MRTNHQAVDPTTDIRGAGAGENFAGGKDAARALGQTTGNVNRNAAGVVEGRPGVIESTHIDPLGENPNDGASWVSGLLSYSCDTMLVLRC